MLSPVVRFDRRRLVIGVAALLVPLGAAVAVLGAPERITSELDVRFSQLIEHAPQLLALALIVPVLPWVAARPQRGVLLLAALVPFDGLLIVVPSPPFAEGWKEALTIFTLVWAALSVMGKPRPAGPLPRFVGPLLLFVGIGIISAFFVRGTQALIGLKIGFLFLAVIVILWLCPFDASDRERLVAILMSMGFVTAVVGLAQQAMGAARLVELGYEYDTHVRFTGGYLRSFSTFNQPFPFAFFLTMVIIIGLPLSLTEPRRLRSVLFFVSLPVLLVALAFTFVRGAWLALGIGLAYLAFRRYQVMLLAAPLALLGLLFLPGQFSAPAFQARSFNERQIGWSENVAQVTARPFGNGIGTTGSAAEKTHDVLQVDEFYYQPDNQYFKVLYELGVIGLWFFVVALVSSLLFLRGAESRLVGLDQAFATGVTAHFLGVLAACVVATYFEIFPMDVYTWLLLGVVAICARESS